MTDRPIIFSGPMLRALVRKRQTRRVLKVQPPRQEDFFGSSFGLSRCVADGVKMYSLNDYDRLPKHPTDWELDGSVGVARDAGFPQRYRSPYAAGDRLWVRENWSHAGVGVWTVGSARMAGRDGVFYAADGEREGAKYWPSIHMPREFSRITLLVDDVKIERLQDISEEDARAEGVCAFAESLDRTPWGDIDQDARDTLVRITYGSARNAFNHLWDTLHGRKSWDENPWVVVPIFRVIPHNIDAMERGGLAASSAAHGRQRSGQA